MTRYADRLLGSVERQNLLRKKQEAQHRADEAKKEAERKAREAAEAENKKAQVPPKSR